MKPVIHTENEPEVVSRITELLIKQGKTQTELLEALGLHRNNFTAWKAGRKRSYLLYIDEIAKYFDVSQTYLLRGEEDEETMKLSQNEEKLIQMYRYLHPESKEKLMATAEVLVNLGRSNTNKNQKEKSGE
ncbi:MAG: helix-turn-helix transcriptional regulator [Clostridia bacterium]|nr:helix-turn-helix transcriptional regulator [Clostridia bacterium]